MTIIIKINTKKLKSCCRSLGKKIEIKSKHLDKLEENLDKLGKKIKDFVSIDFED